jgi:hypothetical protein
MMKSIAAVFIGFLTVVVLSLGTDEVRSLVWSPASGALSRACRCIRVLSGIRSESP